MNFVRQPFQDQVDTAFFFGGGSRRAIVDQIKEAVAGDVPIITLTGTDGAGKTMVCRMVERELADEREIIFFDQGVESFDMVVDGLAAAVALEEAEPGEDRNLRLDKAVELLNRQQRRLVVILDGAERIFLATLERIRRMIDQVNGERLAVQLLLSGRPLFSINYRQLGIIIFKAVEERHFSLDPLDGAATHHYLNHCLDLAGGREKGRFSAAQAEHIVEAARGNFRLTNELAGKYLSSGRVREVSETELEDLYPDDPSLDEPALRSRFMARLKGVDLDFLKIPSLRLRWYVLAAGLVALIILALFWGGGEEKRQDHSKPAAVVPELTLEKVEPDPIEIPPPSLPVVPVVPVPPPPPPEVAPGSDRPAVVEKVPPPPDRAEKTAVQPEVTVPEEKEKPVPAPVAPHPAEPSPEKAEPAAVARERTGPAEPPEKERVVEPPPVAAGAPPVETPVPAPATVAGQRGEAGDEARNITPAPKKIEKTGPDGELKIPALTVLPKNEQRPVSEQVAVVTLKEERKSRADTSGDESARTPAPATVEPVEVGERPAPPEAVVPPAPARTETRPPAAEPIEVAALPAPPQAEAGPPTALSGSAAPPAGRSSDSDRYYAARLAAGSRWLVGGSSNKYTVQLMALDSGDAQENVRAMLGEDGYQPVLDRLYILRRAGQPQSVLLYFGEFDSLAQAREAREGLPAFLRRLEPFEVPIREAVAKAKSSP